MCSIAAGFGSRRAAGGCAAAAAGAKKSRARADGGARAGGDVGSKTKSVRLEKRVQLIEDDTGAGAHAAFVDVEIVDLAIVAREIDDQSFADSVSNQAGTGAARRDRNVFIGRGFNDRARVLRAGWEGDAKRLDLVNRSVSGLKLADEILESHVPP